MEKFIHNILSDLRVELLDEFDMNFQRKAFFDKKWSERRMSGKGTLLVATGKLRRSIRATVTNATLSFTSSEPYAAIHNYG